MKNKTLALITASIITVAALILASALSLLSSSALDQPDALESIDAVSALEGALDEALEGEADAEPEVKENEAVADSKPAEIADTRLPELDTLEVVKEVEEHNGTVVWEYVLWKDIVIDVFEHSTGKLVGQVWITEDEIYEEFCKIFNEDFDYTAELFNPHDPDDVPVYLPEAKYRVEFSWVERLTDYAAGSAGGLAFSYGVENNEIYEFYQTGYPLGNGETVIAYMESLVAEKIAQLEAGIVDELSADDSFATVIGMDGEDGYWNGWTNEVTGERYPGVDRYTPRFPYIEE